MSIRDACHALAGAVDGEDVDALIAGGGGIVDLKTVVVGIVEGVVAGSVCVGASAGVVGGGGDVGVAFDDGFVGTAAGAEHVVAGASAGALDTVAHAGAPGTAATGSGVEIDRVVETRAGRVGLAYNREGTQQGCNDEKY